MKNKSHLKNRGHIKFRMEEVYSHLHNNTNGNKEQSLCCLVLMPCARASTRYARARTNVNVGSFFSSFTGALNIKQPTKHENLSKFG